METKEICLILMVLILVLILISGTGILMKYSNANEYEKKIKKNPVEYAKFNFCDGMGMAYYRDCCWKRYPCADISPPAWKYQIVVFDGKLTLGQKSFVFAGKVPCIVNVYLG